MKKPCRFRQFIPFIALIVVGFFGVEIFRVIMKTADISTLFNYGIGLAGLWVGWQSTRVTVESSEDAKEQLFLSKIEAIDKACEERDRMMQAASDERDRYHEQEIALIRAELAAIATQLEIKKAIYQELIGEIFAMRRDLAEHKAHLAVATRLGEIVLRVDKVQSEVNLMRGGLQSNHF